MGDYDALERRLAELNGKLDAVAQANTGAKLTARLVTVVIVIAAVGGVYLLLRPAIDAYNNPKPYQDALAEEFKTRVFPEISTELQESVKTIGPEVRQLVIKRIESRYEDVVKVVDFEARELVTSLKDHTQTELSGSVTELEAGLKDRITKAVPEIADEANRETVIGNAAVGIENAVKRVVEETFERHITTLNQIELKLLEIPVPDSVKKMDDEELAMELQRALSEYAFAILQHSFSPETKQVLGRLAETPTKTD